MWNYWELEPRCGCTNRIRQSGNQPRRHGVNAYCQPFNSRRQRYPCYLAAQDGQRRLDSSCGLVRNRPTFSWHFLQRHPWQLVCASGVIRRHLTSSRSSLHAGSYRHAGRCLSEHPRRQLRRHLHLASLRGTRVCYRYCQPHSPTICHHPCSRNAGHPRLRPARGYRCT